jgi:hypothetical protein
MLCLVRQRSCCRYAVMRVCLMLTRLADGGMQRCEYLESFCFEFVAEDSLRVLCTTKHRGTISQSVEDLGGRGVLSSSTTRYQIIYRETHRYSLTNLSYNPIRALRSPPCIINQSPPRSRPDQHDNPPRSPHRPRPRHRHRLPRAADRDPVVRPLPSQRPLG